MDSRSVAISVSADSTSSSAYALTPLLHAERAGVDSIFAYKAAFFIGREGKRLFALHCAPAGVGRAVEMGIEAEGAGFRGIFLAGEHGGTGDFLSVNEAGHVVIGFHSREGKGYREIQNERESWPRRTKVRPPTRLHSNRGLTFQAFARRLAEREGLDFMLLTLPRVSPFVQIFFNFSGLFFYALNFKGLRGCIN